MSGGLRGSGLHLSSRQGHSRRVGLLRHGAPCFPTSREYKRDCPPPRPTTRSLQSHVMTALGVTRSACRGTKASVPVPTSDLAFGNMCASPVVANTCRSTALETPSLRRLPDHSNPTRLPRESPSLSRPCNQSILLSRETPAACHPQSHTATLPPPQSCHIPVWSPSFPIWLSGSPRS